MGGFDFTEIHKSQSPFLINDHVHGNHSADRPDDFRLLVVQRVAFNDAVCHLAVFQNPGQCET